MSPRAALLSAPLVRLGRVLARAVSRSAQAAFTYRPRGCNLRGPSACRDSVVHHGDRNAVALGDLSERRSVRGLANAATVTALRLGVSPTTVLRRVIAAAVNAINGQMIGVSGRQRPRLERGEVGGPGGADGNSTAAVAGVRGVCASSSHVLPAFIKARSGGAVFGGPRADCRLRAGASAGEAFPVSQIGPENMALRSALAHAKPNSAALRGIPALMQDGPTTALAASHVDDSRVFRHAPSYHDPEGARRMFWCVP